MAPYPSGATFDCSLRMTGNTGAHATYDDVELPVRKAVFRPAAAQERHQVPGSLTSGGRAASIPAMAGMAPSHRAARRIGALFGQNPPTQTGTRGRCTGVGRTIVIWLPR